MNGLPGKSSSGCRPHSPRLLHPAELSFKGSPTLKTLLAVLKAVGMKLSVEPENRVAAQASLGEPIRQADSKYIAKLAPLSSNLLLCRIACAPLVHWQCFKLKSFK